LRRLAVSALALALAVLAVPAPGTATAATNGRELDLTFDNATMDRQSGAATVTVRTLTHKGGVVKRVSGYESQAARFPAFAQSSNPPLAILTVVDRTGADDLQPVDQKFRFGADFSLDAKSQTSPVDNGNNLIQRGLYDAPMQYKLEMDGNRPRCRVKGDAGAVLVKAGMTVQPKTWYRATCLRSGSTVTLTIERRDDGKTWTFHRSGRIGALRISRSVPLTVGGKAKSPTRINTKASDEFNGKVDNAFLNLIG
jgi:hypothetical protein